MKRYFVVTMAVAISMTSIGCGQSFKSSAATTPLAEQSVNVDDAMTKAQKASDAARKAFADANLALADIMDDSGNVHLSLFSSSGANAQAKASGITGPLIDKLNKVFDQLFAKTDLVKQNLAQARQLLDDALAKLSAAVPAQAAQIDVIRKQLRQLDLLEQDFSMAMHLLAGKLDLATNSLDKLIQQGTSLIPVPGLGMVAGVLIDMFVTNDVKTYIAGVKAKLLAL